MKGQERLIMGESSAYQCFSYCFSRCMGLKNHHNESTINGELFQNGFTPIEQKTNSKKTSKQSGDANGMRQKNVSGRWCCGPGREKDDYTYEAFQHEEGDKISPMIITSLVTTSKDTANGPTYVTTVQPVSKTKAAFNKKPQSDFHSSNNCNSIPDTTVNTRLWPPQTQSPEIRSDVGSRNGKSSPLSDSLHDTEYNISTNLTCSDKGEEKPSALPRENDITEDVPTTVNTVSVNMSPDQNLSPFEHAHNNNDHRKDVSHGLNEPDYSVVAPEAVKADSRHSETDNSSSLADHNMKSDSLKMLKDNLLNLEISSEPISELNKEKEQMKNGNGEGDHTIAYFRKLIETEAKRLTNLIEMWEKFLSEHKDVLEEVQDEIRSVVGQTRLVIAERFKQFGSLVDQSEQYQTLPEEDRAGLKIVTLSDLQGFWDMIFFQVEDVTAKFARLDKAKEQGWNHNSLLESENKKVNKRTVKPVTTKRNRAPKKSTSGLKTEANQEEDRARRQAARKRLMEARKKMAEQNKMNQNENTVLTIAI